MSTHAHSAHEAHGGHETEDFEGTYAIWAIPFSLAMLLLFVLIVILWTPAAASREMRVKEVQGAEESSRAVQEHRTEERNALASNAVSVDRAMRELSTGN